MRRYVVFAFLIVLVFLITSCDNNVNKTIYYNLNIAVIGNGEVSPESGTHRYEKNSLVTLSATPAPGNNFSGWVGPDGNLVNENNKILMNKDMSITAEFTAYDIVSDPNFSVSGGTYTGAQTVTISTTTEDAEIKYTTDGSDPSATHGTIYNGSLNINDDTTLKAIAYKAGMTDSDVVTAEYVINYSLATSVSPSSAGSITVNPDKSTYKYGEQVELTATANSGYNFSGWSGDLSGTTNPESFIVDDDKSVTAEFTAYDIVSDPNFSVSGGTYTGAQTVTISTTTEDAEIKYTTDGSDPSATHGTIYNGSLNINDDTTLKAIAYKAGMTDSDVVTAEYVINYSLATSVSPSSAGSITVNPDKSTYKYGEQVELTATANAGYNFSGWAGDLSGTTNPESFIVDDDKSVTAEFTVSTYNLSFLVKDEADNPIGGATVTINSESKTTDASGEAIFVLNGGNYSYSVSYGNFNEENGNITVDQNKTENVVMLYYASTVSELNSALGDNSVSIINLDNNEYDLSASTCTVDGVKTLKSVNSSTVYLNIDQDYSNITAQEHVTMKHLIDGDLTTNVNRILRLETIINGDLIITAGTLDVNSQKIAVYGSILHRGGILNVNEGDVDVDLDYIIEKADGSGANAILQMTNAADHITVGGNFLMNSNWSHSDKLTAGTLEVKGDFTEKYNYQSRSTHTNFQATDNHKVILSGGGLQSVMFETHSSGSSCFANLELDNTGTLEFASKIAVTEDLVNNMSSEPDNVTNIYLAGTATINSGLSNEGEWPWDMAIYENVTLAQDISIGGDYYLLGNCTLDAAGYTIAVGGNFYQRQGTFNVNGGTVNIIGDYIIEKEDGSRANSILQMTNTSDYITVGGNFLMDSSWSHSDKLTAGTLEIKGDFTEKYNYQSRSTHTNFQATGNHKVILSGSGTQSVMFETASSGTSCFSELELNNTGTLEFASKAAVTGNIINKMSIVPINITNLYLAGTATINSGLSNEGEWPWDMAIHENVTLAQDISIGGDYYLLGNCTVDPGGYTINIGGNFYQRKGTLNVNGSIINITGDYIIEEEDESCAVAYLQMADVADYITVDGNLIMHSQYSSNTLSAGVLEVKGDFTQKHKPMSTSANENFNATGNHKVILSGSSQSVSFAKPHSNDSCFANLELNNTGTLEFVSRVAVTGNLIYTSSNEPGNVTNLYPAGMATINGGTWPWDMGLYENWTLQQNETIEGDLHIFSGSYDENGYTLTVGGSIITH